MRLISTRNRKDNPCDFFYFGHSSRLVSDGYNEKQASVQKEESLLAIAAGGFLTLIKRGRLPTLPLDAVPSAWTGLTSLFGMGRGGTPSP